MIVALAVLSVATGVMASLFTGSLALSANSRHQRIAAALAEEQLAAVLRHPEQYAWPLTAAGNLELFEIRPLVVRAAPQPPSALPAVKAAASRTSGEYGQFSWRAYGRLPAAGAPYLEVTVVVGWTDAGRERLVSLTSAIPRVRVEGAS